MTCFERSDFEWQNYRNNERKLYYISRKVENILINFSGNSEFSRLSRKLSGYLMVLLDTSKTIFKYSYNIYRKLTTVQKMFSENLEL